MNLVGVVIVACLSLASAAQVRIEVPFQLIDGWAIVIEGTIAGVPQKRMLIDTGAVPSAINVNLAKSMGLLGSIEKLSLINRSVDVERVRVPQIQLGRIKADALDMVSMDLGRIEQALRTRIDAVVGLDLLAKQNFSLDYQHEKLTFDGVNADVSALPFHIEEAGGGIFVILPLESGGETLELLLDTGTKDLTLFRPRLRGGLKMLRRRREYTNINAGGDGTSEEVEMASVRVGHLFLRKQRALVWDTSGKDLPNFDGLLGPRSVGIKTLSFDFDRHLLFFETR